MPKFLFLMGLFLWVWASFLRSSEGVMSKLRTEGQEGAGCKSRMFWTMKLEWRCWAGDAGLRRTSLQHRNVKVCREEYVYLLKEGCKQKQWMAWLKHTSYAHWCIFKKVFLPVLSRKKETRSERVSWASAGEWTDRGGGWKRTWNLETESVWGQRDWALTVKRGMYCFSYIRPVVCVLCLSIAYYSHISEEGHCQIAARHICTNNFLWYSVT